MTARIPATVATLLAFFLALSGCGSTAVQPVASIPTDPIDALPSGAFSIVSANEHSDASTPGTVEDVTFRDARGVSHALRLIFTSYPIDPTELTIDGQRAPRGPAWGRLGQRLQGAGLSNNATYLLTCFGEVPGARC